ncbi:MAG: GHKL domain-containing protein [Bacteroidales bacterium]|nr:GHKL domain-containing protein [Bacteroidales bacterium]
MNKSLKYLIPGILLIILSILCNQVFQGLEFGRKDIGRFQNAIEKKYILLDKTMDNLFKTGDIPSFKELGKKGISVLVYQDDLLLNWSDNNIAFPDYYDSLYFSSPLLFNCNAWYLTKTYTCRNFTAVGFIQVKREYPYENKYLKNGFHRSFHLPSTASIHDSKTSHSFEIRNLQGDFVLSVSFNNARKCRFINHYLPSIFYFSGFLVILMFLGSVIRQTTSKIRKNWLIAGLAVFFLVFRVFQTLFRIPAGLYKIELFSPVSFANSELLPSLGDLLLNTILIIYVIIRFNRDFYFPEKLHHPKKSNENSLYLLLMIGIVFYYLFIYHTFNSLIINSSISFEVYKITELSLFSLIGLIIIGLLFTGLVLIVDKTVSVCREKLKIEKLIILFSITLIFGIIFLFLGGNQIDAYSVLFFFIIFTLLVVIRYKRDNLNNYSIQVILVLLFSVYSVYLISRTTTLKDRQNMKILSENLATEHDPVAELLLEEISAELSSDNTLAGMLFDIYHVSRQDINNYLANNYFKGYWSKYDFRFYDCQPSDSVIFNVPNEYSRHCYDYFEHYIGEKGMLIPGSKFYYLDNMNGRINYLGEIIYRDSLSEIPEMTMYIELESRLISEEFGYPELLLDEKVDVNSYLSEYSYAKYHQKDLIAQAGNFHYSLTRDVYGKYNNEFSLIRYDGYDHMVYDIDNENTIIISKPAASFFNFLITFSYLFVFYYILLLLALICFNLSVFKKKFKFNFRNKIQLSIISILLLSLILIGGGTVYFSIEQYQKKNYDNINEKMLSVNIELDHKLAYEEKLSSQWSSDSYENLDQLLLKFSDVFYTDINLFNPSGDLIATTRPEIFERELTGTKMDPRAFREMTIEKKAAFIHHENIGKLNYLSAYVPFMNADNMLLAYLNLPYFTQEDILRQEITTLAVAIINIYVLLILITIAVAFFISDAITKPLRLLQEKFGQIKLLKNHELIEYYGSDEVAGLVSEYNRMVQELQRSAELLAKSERESAWREMARQIAHEIKNPLTPMRLTIQHLQRAWEDKKENYAEIQKKVTQTLIEQIDNLSRIASEFSSFAQMPKADNRKLELNATINKAIGLFSNSTNVKFGFSSKLKDPLYIYADREQISRVFINLFNNAIQSIPEDRKGKIDVSLEKHKNMAIVKIRDNGRGIPDELTDKMFTPNFTTKSSGTGLGLAITKNIIENIHGQISFETSPDRGTVFILELPEYTG